MASPFPAGFNYPTLRFKLPGNQLTLDKLGNQVPDFTTVDVRCYLAKGQAAAGGGKGNTWDLPGANQLEESYRGFAVEPTELPAAVRSGDVADYLDAAGNLVGQFTIFLTTPGAFEELISSKTGTRFTGKLRRIN